MKNEHKKPAPQSTEPEYFPSALLKQPNGARQEYFEQQCLIEHPRLLETLDAAIQAICPPGAGANVRRPGTMVLVIGPTRVGKTTFIRLLEERLFSHARPQMEQDPGFIPFSSVTTAGEDTGRFDWQTYYRAVLRGLRNPFVDGKTARIPTRELREAMEAALLHRKPLAIIVDEAHHLADAAKEEEAQVFRSVLWALQRQLPVLEEPRLVDHWEFLYARSIGCVGLLKMHLNRALNAALTEDAQTVTLTHVRKTALESARVELALRNALESEAELTEPADADERLLTLLGLRGPRRLNAQKVQQSQASPKPRRPGKREPGRDSAGEDGREKATTPSHEEQAAG